jgi:hypothetical protein
MDPAQQERRIGILTVILALLVVVVFWMLYPHKWPFSSEGRGDAPGTEAREAELKKALEDIPPPPGDEPGRLETLHFPGTDRLAVTGIYSTKSGCASLETHYKEEFARRGFTFTGTQQPSNNVDRALSFSSPNYDARLTCTNTAGSFRPYFIVIWSNAGA